MTTKEDTLTASEVLVRTKVKVTSEDGLLTHYLRWVDDATDTFCCLDQVDTDNNFGNVEVNIEITIPSFLERYFTSELITKFSDIIVPAISSENGD